MAPTDAPDFKIPTLGAPRYPSPLLVAGGFADEAADFVPDGPLLLFHDDWSSVQSYAQRGETPPRVEVAGPRERVFFRPADVRAAIVTAGGLCPGINDVVRSIVLTLNWNYGVHDILGIRYGLRGFVAADAPPIPLDPETVKTINRQGGSLLGSSRGAPQVEEVVKFIGREAISVLVLIGGDGTQRALQAISVAARKAGLAVAAIGVPKTIDNDILFVDQSFGFSTAVSLARQAIDAAHAEAQGAYNGVGLVRLMGRESGFIAAQAALASGEPNFVLIPEAPFDLDGPQGFLAQLHRRVLSRRHALVVVAEGAGQEFLAEERQELGVDASGNQRLGDIGRFLRRRIEDYFTERGVPIAVRYIDPGYTIRSATTDASDAVYCQELGQSAVHAAMAGKTEMLIGRIHGRQVHVPVSAAAAGRKRLDPQHPLWRAVLQSTGQPERMVNG